MTSQPDTTTPGAASAAPGAGSLLSLNNVEVIYDDVILVLRGLSLAVPEGKIVALLGSNGAGKSTTLKAVSGLLPSEHGEVTDGSVTFDGQDITKMDAPERVKLGMSLCMEGRHVFEHLTIAENLVAGAYTRKDTAADLDLVYEFFPKLADMRSRVAGYLSGGEQQMLAIARALVRDAKIILLDEPFEGLAPVIVQDLLRVCRDLAASGQTIVVVEQNLSAALTLANRVYIINNGTMVHEGSSEELKGRRDILQRYLGV